MFPELYHAHHSLSNEDVPFWVAQAESSTGELLELGCGTGRVLLPVAQQKVRVFGLDHNAAMLNFFNRRLSASESGIVRLIQADFTRFRLALQFERIILPCNTYSTLGGVERKQLLERIGVHLAPNGRFICSLPNPAVLVELPPRSSLQVEEIFPHPIDGEPVQVSSGWQRSRDVLTIQWRYDHLHPDGSISSLSTQVTHQLTPLSTYLDELHRAGFTVINLWGDFKYEDYSSESPELIIEARAR